MQSHELHRWKHVLREPWSSCLIQNEDVMDTETSHSRGVIPALFFAHIQIPLQLWWVINTGTNHVQSCSFCWRQIYWVTLSFANLAVRHARNTLYIGLYSMHIYDFHHIQQALWKPFLTTDKYCHDKAKILSLFKKKKQKLWTDIKQSFSLISFPDFCSFLCKPDILHGFWTFQSAVCHPH